jgi:hypothetical protein
VRLAREGTFRSASASLDRLWIAMAPDRRSKFGWARVFDASGRTLSELRDAGDAAFGPRGGVVHIQQRRGAAGTAEEWFVLGGEIKFSTGLPSVSDAGVAFQGERGTLVWDTAGEAVAMRAATDVPDSGFFTVYCKVPSLSCRELPLRWSDEVTLLRLLPSSHLPLR